jgi:RNA-binding protein YlmH
MLRDDYLNQKLEDMFRSVDERVSTKYTTFLDRSEIVQAEDYIKSIKKFYPQVEYTLWGGYQGAEREILCVYHTYVGCPLEDFPLSVVQFKYSTNFVKLTHRDFLGSVMALKVTRNSIGDIIVGEGLTQMVVSSNVSQILLEEITRIGRLGVSTSLVDGVTLQVPQEFKDITGTVSSLRLDCVLGVALKLSRSNAVQLVKSKAVAVNYLEQTNQDYTLKQGDIFTVRGFGKYLLAEVSEPTKKDRLHVIVKKYL